MGNTSTVKKLTAEQNQLVDSCIRRRRFVSIDAIRAELSSSGVEISRGSLYRYMQSLKVRDGLHLGTPDDVVVVVMRRSTGSLMSLTTSASTEMILAMFGGLPVPK